MNHLYERMYDLQSTIEEWERKGIFNGDSTYQKMLRELEEIEEEIANQEED